MSETYAFLRTKENAQRGGSDGSITDAIKGLVDACTPAQRNRLSDAMAQGAYQNTKPGVTVRGPARQQANTVRAVEQDERQHRRGLILVMLAKSTKPFDAALQDALTITNQISPNGIFALNTRLDNELTNATARIAGVRVQIMQINWAGWDRAKYRPLRAGAAIGQRGEPGPGTLGCFVERNGEIFILSNYHVLRQANAGDDEIIQPAHMVGGSYLDVVADYVDGEPTLDAAIARVRRDIQVDNRTTGPNPIVITGHSVNVANNDSIQKCGCSTGRRRGTVVDANPITTPPRNMHGVGITNHQIRVARDDNADQRLDVDFQVQGDSGTVICDMTGDVVGMLNVKHPDGSALATLILPILQRFNVQVLAPGVHVAPGLLGNLLRFRTKTLQRNPAGGIRHDLEWDSSTGDRADLAHIKIREHVSWPTPAPAALPYIIDPEPLEDYTRAGDHYGQGNAASTPGTAEYARDEHSAIGLFKPNFTTHAGADIVVTFTQVYEIKVGNAAWAPIPGSQYTIERRITALPTGRVRVTLTKTNTTNAGDRLANSLDT